MPLVVRTSGVGRQVRVPICVKRALAKYAILAVFTHHIQGANAARSLLRGVVAGSFTFVVFFLVISLLVNRWGIAVAFSLAILAALATHSTSLFMIRRNSNA
jgi:hypothetical protein